jgi:hypothetical protein
LAYGSTTDKSMAYLRRVHGKYLPSRPVLYDSSDASTASSVDEETQEAKIA